MCRSLRQITRRKAYHVLVGLVTHESSKSDDWSDASEEHEENGGDGLHVDGVLKVTQVVGVAAFYVTNQSTKQSAEEEMRSKQQQEMDGWKAFQRRLA